MFVVDYCFFINENPPTVVVVVVCEVDPFAPWPWELFLLLASLVSVM